MNGRKSVSLSHRISDTGAGIHIKMSLSISAFKYACCTSTVATSIFFDAAIDAMVNTEDVAVVGDDRSLSGMSFIFW